jgi:hypothetical protein
MDIGPADVFGLRLGRIFGYQAGQLLCLHRRFVGIGIARFVAGGRRLRPSAVADGQQCGNGEAVQNKRCFHDFLSRKFSGNVKHGSATLPPAATIEWQATAPAVVYMPFTTRQKLARPQSR